MMIPDSAIVPSIATKPNGLPNASSASVDADQAERRGQHDHRVRAKLFNCIISSVSTHDDEQRHAGDDRLLPRRRVLDRAAHLDPVAERQRGAERRRAAGRSGS